MTFFTIRELLVSIKMPSANPWKLKSENLSLSASRTPPPQNYIKKFIHLCHFRKSYFSAIHYIIKSVGLS
jgi:hypothetical protein